jgi:hypothetical protein
MKTSRVLPLLLLGLVGGPSMPAQSPGTFSATGSMIAPRFGHTATLLPGVKVLIAGGYTDTFAPVSFPESGHPIAATAELYDPDTGTFTATGKMITARAYHTATLLPDGRVLIAAGMGSFGNPSSGGAELYDPSTGAFSATGTMTAFIGSYNTATLLPDGRVLITGLPANAELYDPGTGTFTVTGNMTVPPQGVATATLLPNGQVLLASARRSNWAQLARSLNRSYVA